MSKFFNSLFIDIVFCVLYFLMYKFLGFEYMVIIALGTIVSTLLQQDRREQKRNQSPRQFYTQSKNRIKF